MNIFFSDIFRSWQFYTVDCGVKTCIPEFGNALPSAV
jgi:hypothetical protein